MRIAQFDGVTVVKQADDEDLAAFYGPDREANARLFVNAGELVEAAEALNDLCLALLNSPKASLGDRQIREALTRRTSNLTSILTKIDTKP